MFFEKTRNAAGMMAVLASLPFGPTAWGETPSQRAQHDLSKYATIIVGYDIDGRCQVLNKRQRTDYLKHMQVIRHAFEKKGLSPYLLDQMEENARAIGQRQFSACNREMAEMVERIGVLTASFGKHMAHWLIKATPQQNQ